MTIAAAVASRSCATISIWRGVSEILIMAKAAASSWLFNSGV
jgi:hypothetical protein